MIMIVSNVPLLSDIGKQYKAGLHSNGEWTLLLSNHLLHLILFVTLVLLSLFTSYFARE